MLRSIIVVIGVLLLASALIAQNQEKVWNFDTNKPGDIPGGVTNEVGEWKVVADQPAPPNRMHWHRWRKIQDQRLMSRWSAARTTKTWMSRLR